MSAPKTVDVVTQPGEVLAAAGLPADAIVGYLAVQPSLARDYARDAAAFSQFWQRGMALRSKLSPKARRNAAEGAASDLLHRLERAAREAFLSVHAETVYRKLTDGLRKFVRIEELVFDAAALLPGLAPSREALARDAAHDLRDQDALAVDQGIFLSHVFANETAGRHLCHAMLLPRPETAERLPQFLAQGSLDLGGAAVYRAGKAAVVEMRNPRFLNALDDTVVDAIEIAVDVAIGDPQSDVAVLRGGVVEHPRYKARRVFSSGLNLTHLDRGKISYLFYFRHLAGFENKIYRGLAHPDIAPDEEHGGTTEKPWIAAVDAFAIGGGCQHLLVMDYVLAASDAYLTLPARKEGIVPGAAPMRLPRFTGDRIAHQAIMSGRRLDCDSPEGRLVCDEIVPPAEMDTALARAIEGLTGSGVVSAVSNRRSFRIMQEPLDAFRRYLAVYAREQAYCHYSPALIANLERHWNAQARDL